MIRPASLQDGPAIAAIYNHYVTNTVVTFETEPVSEEEMTARVERVGASFPWLVYTRDQEVLGYAYANTLKDRRAYDRSAETTVYVRQDSGRQGVGGALYTALLESVVTTVVVSAISVLCYYFVGLSIPCYNAIDEWNFLQRTRSFIHDFQFTETPHGLPTPTHPPTHPPTHSPIKAR